MNRSLAIDHDALPEVCDRRDIHVPGCPCRAGGDAEYVTVSVSYIRCSECGDLLQSDGSCPVHGLLDPEDHDNRHQDTVEGCAFCEKRAENAAAIWEWILS